MNISVEIKSIFKWFLRLSFICALVVIFAFLYRSETRFNPALFARTHATIIDAEELAKHPELEGKLVAVSGVVTADDVIHEASFPGNEFIVFDRIEKIYKRSGARGSSRRWVASHNIQTTKKAYLSSFYFYPHEVTAFFNMPYIKPEHYSRDHEIFISYDGMSSKDSPRVGDKRISFCGIQPGAHITVLGQVHDRRLRAYPIFSPKSWIEHTFNDWFDEQPLFYVSEGSFEDLLAELKEGHVRQLEYVQIFMFSMLCLVLLLPLSLPFISLLNRLWPEKNQFKDFLVKFIVVLGVFLLAYFVLKLFVMLIRTYPKIHKYLKA